MSKPLAIPYDYPCPYRQACPHLQGMSTAAIWHRHELDSQPAQRDRERIDQLVEWLNEREQQVRRLEQESQQLRAQIKALHQKQFKANPPAPTPQEASLAPKKKRGAPVGPLPAGRQVRPGNSPLPTTWIKGSPCRRPRAVRMVRVPACIR